MNSHVEQRRAFLIDFAYVALILALIYVFFKFLFWITAPFLLSFFFAVLLQKPLRYLDKKTNKKAHAFWSIFLVVVSTAVVIVPLVFILTAVFGKISDFINYISEQLSDISSFLSTVENWILNTLQFLPKGIYHSVSETITSWFDKLQPNAAAGAASSAGLLSNLDLGSITSKLSSGVSNVYSIVKGVPSILIGVVIGMLIALIKFFAEDVPSLRPLSFICDLYVTVIRGIPVVVLLLIFYYIIMVSAEGTAVGIITFGINSGAYMAELIRGGIGAVDRGQMEAGRSLGMSRLQAMRKVVFPQAVKNILPAIGNEFISLLKETSVAGYVAVVDITRAGNLIRNNTYDAVNPLLVVAIVYLSMVVALSQLMRRLERRLGKSDKRS